MDGYIGAFMALMMITGILAVAAVCMALYCMAVIWALNYLAGTSIGYWDLWAWLAILVLTSVIKCR